MYVIVWSIENISRGVVTVVTVMTQSFHSHRPLTFQGLLQL